MTFISLKKIFAFWLFLSFLFYGIAGCVKVGPDFVRPEAPVSVTWMETGNTRLNTGKPDFRSWWRVFNDPVLDQLIELAYRDNLTLRIAGMRVLQARARLGIAIGSFYPQTQALAGSLQLNRLSKEALFGTVTSYTQDQIGADVGWELDFWGRYRRAIEAADGDWLASAANYDSTLVSLTADVAAAYILIRSLEQRILIARENATVQKENLGIAEARFKYGLTSQLDVAQAATLFNNTLALVPALDAQLIQARDALCILLGMPPNRLADLLRKSSQIPVSPPQVAVGIPTDLLRRRPDIRSAEYQAAAQCARIGVAKADYYPVFSLNGTFGFLSTDVGQSSLGDMFKWSSRTYQVGPTIQWPIFNYGRITDNVRLQDAVFQELIFTYQNTVLAAQRDVEDNLAAFLRAQERADFLALSSDSARRALDLAVLQYREGVRDFTAVLTAQQALLTEQDNLATTLGNLSSSLVGVYRALGGGWESREGADLVPPSIRAEMTARTDWGRLLSPAQYNPPLQKEPESRPRLPDW